MNGKTTGFGWQGIMRRRALTPVISTMILISVTISTSISAAFWMKSTGYVFTGFEKLECQSAHPSYDYVTRTWKISIVVRNVGTRASTITQVYANERGLSPGVINPTPGNGGTDVPSCGVSVNQGATVTFNIYCRQGGQSQPFSELFGRQTLLIKFVTAEGIEYVTICELCPPSA